MSRQSKNEKRGGKKADYKKLIANGQQTRTSERTNKEKVRIKAVNYRSRNEVSSLDLFCSNERTRPRSLALFPKMLAACIVKRANKITRSCSSTRKRNPLTFLILRLVLRVSKLSSAHCYFLPRLLS